ncbi:NUDIX domain-containing protein [Actinoallomurus sp. NPDC052274]|uniref:NUDIX domain-containing protein n=1 Tax=Actinoallomurus sp. NPDC052274 TaxID=3155420 RepID=UPI00343B0732
MILPEPFIDPSVLEGIKAGASWADSRDVTEIDWVKRRLDAWIDFDVINGRPVKPGKSTGKRQGRYMLGHWGEAKAADAVVFVFDRNGRRWIVMVERADGHGWAVPGGYVDPGESALQTAVRELGEETGLKLPGASWTETEARPVPDPRESDESWMVTKPCVGDGGVVDRLPSLKGQDDAKQAVWVPADSYDELVEYLDRVHGGKVFAAHVDMLRSLL